MMVSANARTLLEDLRGRVDGIATAWVSRDGRVLSANLPAGPYAEPFAVMCATMFGAAAAGNAELQRGPPVRVVTEGDDSRTLIVRAGEKALLVVVVDRFVDFSAVLDQTMKFACTLTAESSPGASG